MCFHDFTSRDRLWLLSLLMPSECQKKCVLGPVTAGWLAESSAQSLSLQAPAKCHAAAPTRWLRRETKLLGCRKQLCMVISLPALRDGWCGDAVTFQLRLTLKSCLV